MQAAKKSRYTLIKGKFWIQYPDTPKQGPQPDGDTVTFQPDDVQLVQSVPWLSGKGPNINTRGTIPVRYEGIDALETHFRGAHQDLSFANAARDENLRQLGFQNVVFFPDLPNNVQSVTANPLPGYVLANGIESNGRLLGLVYSGTTADVDGLKVRVEAPLLNCSVNVKLVKQGLAYVEPYDSMPMALIVEMRNVIHAGRVAKVGMFPRENVGTASAATISNLAQLSSLIMWPKLYRRLVAYFAEGNTGLANFDAWIRIDPVGRDDSLRLPNGEKANMHDTFLVTGDSLTLAFNPEDLIVAPDPKPMT